MIITTFKYRIQDNLFKSWKNKSVTDIKQYYDILNMSNEFYSLDTIKISIEYNLFNLFKYLINKSKNMDFIYNNMPTERDEYNYNDNKYKKYESSFYTDVVIEHIIRNGYTLDCDLNPNNEIIIKSIETKKLKKFNENICILFNLSIYHKKYMHVKYLLKYVDFYFDDSFDVDLNIIYKFKIIKMCLNSHKIPIKTKRNILKYIIKYSKKDNIFCKIIKDVSIFNNDIINYDYLVELFFDTVENHTNLKFFDELYKYNLKYNIVENDLIFDYIIENDNLYAYKTYINYNNINVEDVLAKILKIKMYNYNILEYIIENDDLTENAIKLILNGNIDNYDINLLILNSHKIQDSPDLDIFIENILLEKTIYKITKYISSNRKIKMSLLTKFINYNIETSLFVAIINNSGFEYCDDIISKSYLYDYSYLKIYVEKFPNFKIKTENTNYLVRNYKKIEYCLLNDLFENKKQQLEYLFINICSDSSNRYDRINCLVLIANDIDFQFTHNIVECIQNHEKIEINLELKRYYLELLKKIRKSKIKNIING